MSIKLYKDIEANAVFIEDANGSQFLNSLQASSASSLVTITDLAKQIDIVTGANHTDFIDQNDNPYTGDLASIINQLNAIFQSTGTPTGQAPVITSPLTISLTTGQTINYELTATYGVGYEWDLSAVSGVTTVEGNIRKLIGCSSLAAGTCNIPVKAINYNGEDSKTIVLTVSNPPYSNTKSVQFNQNDWLGANANLLDATLGRNANGSGSADAWTIAFYFKAGSSNNQQQTIFYFGANDVANSNHFRIYWNGNNAIRQQLILQYGTTNNNLVLKTPVGSVSNDNSWHHYLISYDGGTTGASSGQINNYYSRFKIFIDGVQQTTTNSNSNFGITTGLIGQNLRVARYNAGNYLRNNCKIDELLVFNSDQSGNVSAIYNSGTPFDYSLLTTPPVHWWRMGDGDTFANLQDSGTIGGAVFIMNNMTAADIVSDVP